MLTKVLFNKIKCDLNEIPQSRGDKDLIQFDPCTLVMEWVELHMESVIKGQGTNHLQSDHYTELIRRTSVAW